MFWKRSAAEVFILLPVSRAVNRHIIVVEGFENPSDPRGCGRVLGEGSDKPRLRPLPGISFKEQGCDSTVLEPCPGKRPASRRLVAAGPRWTENKLAGKQPAWTSLDKVQHEAFALDYHTLMLNNLCNDALKG